MVFPSCGTHSEEQRPFGATGATGADIGTARNVFTVKKEEGVDLDADVDADVAADVDARGRVTRAYRYSKAGSGGTVPRTAAAMQKSRRRAANRASAKRIRIRQQQHLQKLECETRELAALCKAMRADLAEASRQVAAHKERNEALVGEKQWLLRLLGERQSSGL
ncbi:unnamed protein product [Closterium sp. Naga37s-1]|nr:unnamed protein product [Closterium sp. Naga37s-1]